MQAYSSTLLQFIFKFQLVYFPYFYDDKVQKNAPIWCIVATKWCIVISQDILEIEKYQPKTRDICLYLSKSHNWGGRGRKFKSCHSDQHFV